MVVIFFLCYNEFVKEVSYVAVKAFWVCILTYIAKISDRILKLLRYDVSETYIFDWSEKSAYF